MRSQYVSKFNEVKWLSAHAGEISLIPAYLLRSDDSGFSCARPPLRLRFSLETLICDSSGPLFAE